MLIKHQLEKAMARHHQLRIMFVSTVVALRRCVASQNSRRRKQLNRNNSSSNHNKQHVNHHRLGNGRKENQVSHHLGVPKGNVIRRHQEHEMGGHGENCRLRVVNGPLLPRETAIDHHYPLPGGNAKDCLVHLLPGVLVTKYRLFHHHDERSEIGHLPIILPHLGE